MIASTLWVFASLSRWGIWIRKASSASSFIFLLSAGITLGITFSGNLFTFYLFYELLTFATYPNLVHSGGEDAAKAGGKCLQLGWCWLNFSSHLMLWRLTGGILDFVLYICSTSNASGAAGYAVLPVLYSFGVKAAIMPLHGWRRRLDTPVVLLHAVAW